MADVDGIERLQGLIGEDYRLQWIIGRGGMSTVWLADDVVNDREVAIKVLRPEFSDNNEFLERFRNEADAAQLIDSDNVVRTYDYREIPDPAGHTFCFIAMEYVRGESLADLLLREGPLHETLALDVLEQAAHGLSIIHRMGMVHRDIKPGNLMVTQNGRVKITDFGIAKAAAAVPLTRTGMVVGTAQYVSPEQAQGQEVTSSSDVYSLGVVGYEMLAGKRPFTGDSSVSVALAHINNAPPALSTQVTAQTRELIGIALRKDPNARFADGNEMALAVSAVRLGKRPPQPASAAMARVAPEPSPTASTRALGAVAHPTTVHPATELATGAGAGAAAGMAGGAAATRPPTSSGPVQAPSRKADTGRSGGFGTGILIAVVIAAAVGGAVLAAQAGLFSGLTGGDDPEPSTVPPEVVTEWVTPTPSPEPAPTQWWNPTPAPTSPRENSPTTRPQQSPTPGPTSPPEGTPPTQITPPPVTVPTTGGNDGGTGGTGGDGGGTGDTGDTGDTGGTATGNAGGTGGTGTVDDPGTAAQGNAGADSGDIPGAAVTQQIDGPANQTNGGGP
ncbi:serine/threonine-protein kinase [Corynebacterium halotolerans]|uniref:non-specific serine/threonine protein kinase n=1 Tax=Corynebacterium halotolerans YIM 70093 = DSM 44683 TaxID=1121362 RepID=M1NI22_9CORY|nr:serine/threonine-protein kinase [Corynebacterium halotolerans]AGF71038.1 serine/threonine-protein kinase [Corynebacterium halotolerans YIM 70093 = DSM 44683]